MDVEVERGAETLDDGHTAGLESAAYAVRPGAPPKAARHDRDEGTQHDAGERGAGERSGGFRYLLWALQGLNLRLRPCEGRTLPLS